MVDSSQSQQCLFRARLYTQFNQVFIEKALSIYNMFLQSKNL